MAPSKRNAAASSNGRRAKRTKPTRKQSFMFNEHEWIQGKKLCQGVFVWKSKESLDRVVVRKQLKIYHPSVGPEEIYALSMLPDCNRIVKPFYYSPCADDPKSGFALFPYFPLGDVRQWKWEHFDKMQWKPVPESFIWRFFIQMSQALAFIHNEMEPRQEGAAALIHRDIKPANVLVVNNGTTYPSFKLHDFGLSQRFSTEKALQPARIGTFEWQPPENPLINTKAADVWALGACVHFLATGEAPTESIRQTRLAYEAEFGSDTPSMQMYKTIDHLAAARAYRRPLQINISREAQILAGTTPRAEGRPQSRHQYSDELAEWMNACLERDPNRRVTAKRLLVNMVQEAKPILKRMGGQAALFDLEVQAGSQ